LFPHPPEGTELSTGTLRGSDKDSAVGVAVPGVAGGVKAGESSEGGGAGCANGVDGGKDEEGAVWLIGDVLPAS